MKLVALCPAHNEEVGIEETIRTLANQEQPFAQIVVISNGSTDGTVEIASRVAQDYDNVIVLNYPKLEHKKCEALNLAWRSFCLDADLVVTVDADTVLNPDATREWAKEFRDNPNLAGAQAKFTMRPGGGLLSRLQRAEYALGIDRCLRKGSTTILAGAASCYRNSMLREVMQVDGRVGPWSYESAVEDFELTYQLRRMNYKCIISPNIRAYTDAMPNVKALRSQRNKWLAGTITDLLRFGFNRYTRKNWTEQIFAMAASLIAILWIVMMSKAIAYGSLSFNPWWMILPAVCLANNIRHAWRIPHRDWIDMTIAATLIIGEIYTWVRLVWLMNAWRGVLLSKMTGKKTDLWQAQAIAEGNLHYSNKGKHYDYAG